MKTSGEPCFVVVLDADFASPTGHMLISIVQFDVRIGECNACSLGVAFLWKQPSRLGAVILPAFIEWWRVM